MLPAARRFVPVATRRRCPQCRALRRRCPALLQHAIRDPSDRKRSRGTPLLVEKSLSLNRSFVNWARVHLLFSYDLPALLRAAPGLPRHRILSNGLLKTAG